MAPAPEEILVFDILRESQCAECGSELERGSLLLMDKQRLLCMQCADLDHLVFLPRGDTALTRRAKKHSRLSAVVVRFSRARKRYERQGLLVEEAALAQAETECLADAARRERQRERAEVRRAAGDVALVTRMTEAIVQLFPGCPSAEASQIAAHTAARSSGRVGRTAAGQSLDPSALRAAVIAHIRHRHTPYDDLLMAGFDRADARDRVRNRIDLVLESWEA